MAKGRLKKKVQDAMDKLSGKLQNDADDIASIEVPEVQEEVETVVVEEAPKPAPKKKPQEDTWKIRA